nr:hypothetical protein [Streptomyces sp. Amel2xB2]
MRGVGRGVGRGGALRGAFGGTESIRRLGEQFGLGLDGHDPVDGPVHPSPAHGAYVGGERGRAQQRRRREIRGGVLPRQQVPVRQGALVERFGSAAEGGPYGGGQLPGGGSAA